MTISNERIYYEHLRGFVDHEPAKGAVTLAFSLTISEDEAGHQSVYIRYGYSLCSPKDQFCKAVGRRNATNRWFDNPRYIELPGVRLADIANELSFTSNGVALALELIKSDLLINVSNTPNWFRKIGEYVMELHDDRAYNQMVRAYRNLAMQRAF